MRRFACNDERGNFTGKAERIEIGALSLVCTLMYGGVKLETVAGQQVRVGRLILPYSDYKYGVGNWCWDGYRFDEEDVLKIISYLQKSKNWTCEEGPCEQFDKFNSKQSFTKADLKALA